MSHGSNAHEPGRMTVCYPLSCFLMGSFAGPPGKRDYLENVHQGSQHYKRGSQLTGLARLSCNRKLIVVAFN